MDFDRTCSNGWPHEPSQASMPSSKRFKHTAPSQVRCQPPWDALSSMSVNDRSWNFRPDPTGFGVGSESAGPPTQHYSQEDMRQQSIADPYSEAREPEIEVNGGMDINAMIYNLTQTHRKLIVAYYGRYKLKDGRYRSVFQVGYA